ncbi:unnamed protein product [Rhizophagus irregularis]|uniref:Uncharacterized protein n=1 Tax=Rhizophagus irregularis TaxID=588596 RepID=A0A2N1N060_9GLOM|nr:hypothetical protein RhiirC2_783720 [Rhizophagus irregularis]PKK67636.1 hypothetical protein RhiirC2_783281 [Rhizophagus irregularis]CAB4388743.1 unnamed protein product [Rhizophagus irregularis]CAB5380309.1 unnamed protein product [Rhizophagus irregularis]
MWQRFLGASSVVAVVATNSSRAIQPQDNHNLNNVKRVNCYDNHYNNRSHYHFAFSRYGQSQHTNNTKSKRTKYGKRFVKNYL